MTPRAARSSTRSSRLTGETVGRRKLLVGLLGGVVRQHARRVRRPDRLARTQARAASAAAPSWRAGSRLVTVGGDADRARPARRSTSWSPCSPRAHIGVDDSQVVLLRLPPDAADRRAPSSAAPSTGGSPTPRSAPTPAARSGCSASTTARPKTLRQLVCPCHQSCSTRSTAPVRSAARRPARCRSSPSTSTPTASSSPRASSRRRRSARLERGRRVRGMSVRVFERANHRCGPFAHWYPVWSAPVEPSHDSMVHQ